MRSPIALEPRRSSPLVTAAGLLLAVALAPRIASAEDDKKVCSEAYEQTQKLRRDGKLGAARAAGIVCSRDVCQDFVRADCAKWLNEIERDQPTVVLAVVDAAGHDTNAARVSLDGAPWLKQVDGQAKAVDPGHHVLRFELDGAPAHEETVEIREGEKNRRIQVSFIPAVLAVPGTPPPVTERREDSPSLAPWVIGGVGVVGLIVGAVAGGLVLADKGTASSNCNDLAKTCSSAGANAANAGKKLGPVSTVGFVVGGAGIAVAAIWLGVRGKSAPAPSVARGLVVAPVVSEGGGGLRVGGVF